MIARRVVLGLCLAAGLSACDEVEAIVTEASQKGGTDVPESARAPLAPETQDALRRRIEGQNFN